MTSIVLFHSILGLRQVERDVARTFESSGHWVILPDLFEGRVAHAYEEAFRMKDEIGEAAIVARAAKALQDAPPDAVLAGVSFGAFLIGHFWQDRPQMAGALFFSGVAPWRKPPR
jgi:dienelactone hydrolase